jgi:chromosomal replication initiation ATPase DnaA
MKQDVFNQYVERVTNMFNISKEDFYSNIKKREFVDARHLVYYLCSKRPMQITYIQRYMNDAGSNVKHPSIIHGISAVEQRILDDKDYISVIKDVERAVFI